MITKKDYTKDGRHPEDVIYKEIDFRSEVSKILSQRFEQLVVDLRLTADGADHLMNYFDNYSFLHDNEEILEFDEFLSENYDIEYGDIHK
jgi:hypothetical protein